MSVPAELFYCPKYDRTAYLIIKISGARMWVMSVSIKKYILDLESQRITVVCECRQACWYRHFTATNGRGGKEGCVAVQQDNRRWCRGWTQCSNGLFLLQARQGIRLRSMRIYGHRDQEQQVVQWFPALMHTIYCACILCSMVYWCEI